VRKHGLEGQAVEIIGQAMTTDNETSFDAENLHDRSCINMIGFPMARNCADQVYKMAGVGPEDVDVIELHDCFSCNELVTYVVFVQFYKSYRIRKLYSNTGTKRCVSVRRERVEISSRVVTVRTVVNT